MKRLRWVLGQGCAKEKHMSTWGWVGVGGLVAAVVLAVTCGSKGRRGGSRKSGGKSGGKSRSRVATKFVASKDKKLDSQRKLGVVYMKEAARLQLSLAKFLAQNKRKEAKSIVSKLAKLEEKINRLRLRGAALAA